MIYFKSNQENNVNQWFKDKDVYVGTLLKLF